jgi:hypothetical protein
MDREIPAKRPLAGIVRIPAALLGAIRRVLGSVFQVVFRNQLKELNEQTRRLGAASVEASTYTSTELHNLERRLARIEEELAELREQRR